MTGSKLRECLILGSVSIKGLAEKLNMSQPNLSAQFKVQDIKTGVLEKICDALGVTLDFFYGGTQYIKKEEEKEENVSCQEFVPMGELCKGTDGKDQQILYLKGQIKALKETIKLLCGKNVDLEEAMPLQKINA